MDTSGRVERGWRVIALVLGLQVALALPAYAQETHAFNVRATSPAIAIQTFGQQSRLQIVASAQALDGKQLNPVAGELTTDAAFQTLLAGTGLVPKYVEGRSVAIVSREAALSAPSARKEGDAGDPGIFRVAEANAGGTAAVASGPGAASREAPALEEVVVTAQKRAERLQDVPVAVTAVSGGALEAIHATSLADYAAFIPSLQVISFLGQPGQVNLALRGVTTGSTAANQTVATYVDDVPVGSSSIYAGGGSSGIDVLPYDVGRIEVLEGPQGTLYGASALGGILKYVTREPDLRETQFRVGLDLSGMENASRAGYGARASANLPLIPDALGLSLSVSHGYTPGYIDDVATGKRSFNSGVQDAARAALLWSPSAQLSLELSALYNRSPFNGTGAVSVATAGQPTLGRYDNTDVEPDSNNVTTQLYMARLRYDLGWGSLISVSSFSRMSSLSEADGSSIFLPFFGDNAAFTTRSDVKKFTQELRLASPAQQSLEWVAGAFYTSEDATAGQTGLALVPATNQSDPALSPLIVTDEPSHFREAAVFGNATYLFTPAWDLSAGVRASRNQQSVRESAYGSLFGTTQSTAAVTPFPDVTQNKTTWSVSSSYHLTPDQMIYARVATGYRPGGANKIAPDAPPTFGPDTTTNYEIGLKSEWLERRLLLNLTAFYIDWRNTQVTGVTPLYLTYLSNAGAAVSKGAELATRFTPARGLTFGFNATYTDAYLTVDAPALGGLRGDPLPSTPKLAGSLTLDYEFPVAAGLQGLVNAAARYEGARNTAFPSDPTVSGNYRLSSYTTLDVSAGVLRAAWSARLYVRNATNRYAYLFVIPPGGAGAPSTNVILQPRSYGLSLDVRF